VRRQWLRRWVVWRYVIASVLLVALVAGAVWLVFISSVLTVKKVDVQGDSFLSREQILTAAEVPTGGHLAQLDLEAIRSRVSALAPVRHVDVSREWPDGVLIKVTERTPVAVVQIGGAFHAMDADGVLFRDYPRAPVGMPRVLTSADTGSAALAEAARVIASLPRDLAARVDHVQVRGMDQISLAMRSGATVVWGSDAQSTLKAEVLARLLTRPAGTYDVSVPGQPVTSVL
jgi:cell division protein FtsQ